MRSAESKRLEALEASLLTVQYQIEHLTPYYSYLQVRAWRSRRAKLKKEIKLLKAILKARKNDVPLFKSIKNEWSKSHVLTESYIRKNKLYF